MAYKLCVFAGTTEGRRLGEFLSSQDVYADFFAATEYGGTLLPHSDKLKVFSGRLSAAEIEDRLGREKYDLVIDATHPYASEVTESILKACEKTGTKRIRLQRENSEMPEDIIIVPDTKSAAVFLNDKEGNILLATGSKELAVYKDIPDFAGRVYARVLPVESSLKACADAGLAPSHIIAMQGPFSAAMNEAMLQYCAAEWMVTKDGAGAGGFDDKLEAARRTGTVLVVIGRPAGNDGIPYSRVIRILCTEYGCVRKPRVHIVGIGPGSLSFMTEDSRKAISDSECLIGAKRMLDAAGRTGEGKAAHEQISAEGIYRYIEDHEEYNSFAVLMSGDTGFFSGAKRLLEKLDDCITTLHPGISSMSYLCSRLHRSYDDVQIMSLHGREGNIIPEVRRNKKVFVLVGGQGAAADLCRRLADAGLGHVNVCVGENLSYPDEKITCGCAGELENADFSTLSAVLIENEDPVNSLIPVGIPDECFIRSTDGKLPVPMTKEEVRAVCISKLRLSKDSVCWDIGAGTGSVSVEMALQASDGSVFAVEKREDAAALLEENKKAFHADNIKIIQGLAPDALKDLPAPTHAFIGGSSGNIRQIISLLMEKNANVRIVATAVTLESVAEITSCMNEFGFDFTQTVSVTVARDRKAGPYHLMTGQNPVYIFTMQSGE